MDRSKPKPWGASGPLALLRELATLPRIEVGLDYQAALDNHEFFPRIVKEFYRQTQRRHRRFPLVKAMSWGMAVCELPGGFERYFLSLEEPSRRNYVKSLKAGQRFARIDFNRHLQEIAEIRGSTQVRQGRVPAEFLRGEVEPCTDPPTRSDLHDYPYFGVFADGRLAAYAGCMVAGEAFMIQHILGHADYQSQAVVPRLIMDMARVAIDFYPRARYFMYGTHYGARPDLRRFKQKFGLTPHRVRWRL